MHQFLLDLSISKHRYAINSNVLCQPWMKKRNIRLLRRNQAHSLSTLAAYAFVNSFMIVREIENLLNTHQDPLVSGLVLSVLTKFLRNIYLTILVVLTQLLVVICWQFVIWMCKYTTMKQWNLNCLVRKSCRILYYIFVGNLNIYFCHIKL